MSDEAKIEWIVPGSSDKNSRSTRVQRCLDLAATCARDFDSSFGMHSAERECALPQFAPDELVLSDEPMRVSGFYAEYELREALVSDEDLNSGMAGEAKRRFSARSDDGYFSVKFLQDGIVEQDHAPNATTEMILEVKILMSLASHPNISKIYGITSEGIDSLSRPSCYGYFFITDRVSETLVVRMDSWRHSQGESSLITQRLEIALDIASALVFLHDRKLVFYIRPDKVGFDARQGGVKLFNFGQARQHGMGSHPRSVTQSDNMHSLAYTAPEVFCMVPAHPGTDVFGFGVLLWEMMSLEHPFEGFDRAMHFEQVVRLNRRPLAIDDNWDKDIADMLQCCWHPHKRRSMKEVHSKLETRLLFQEPSNEIKDTALKLKRHNSEGFPPNPNDEIGDASQKIVRRHSDGIVVALSPSTIPENDNIDKLREIVNIDASVDQDSKVYANESKTNLPVSVPDFHASMKLDEAFQEAGPSANGRPQSSGSKDSKVKRSRSLKVSKEKQRTRSKSRTRTWAHSNSAPIVTNMVREDEKVAMGASANTLGTNDHDDVGDVDDEEEVIASLMSQSDERSGAEFQLATATKQHKSQVQEKSVTPARQSRRNIVIRRRSKSVGKTTDLGDSSESEGQPSPSKATPRRERVKLSTQAVATQMALRVTRQRSLSRVLGQEHAAVQRTQSDESGMIRMRRASVVEVKRSFDFEPDTPKLAATTATIKQIQNSVEKATPLTPLSPQKAMHSPRKATAGKRMLVGILRMGSGKDLEQSPQPTPRSFVRRSSLVLDIVGQHQSFRDTEGKNDRMENADTSQEEQSSRRASVY